MYAIRLKQRIDGKRMYVGRVNNCYTLLHNIGTTWKTPPTVTTSAGSAISYALHNSLSYRNHFDFCNIDIAKALNVVFPDDQNKWPSTEQVFHDLLEIVKVEFVEV